MSRPVVILDTETSGLWPELGHEVWEVGAIEYSNGRREHMWRTEPHLATADPEALEVNQYHLRTMTMQHGPAGAHDLTAASRPTSKGLYWSDPAALAAELEAFLRDVTIVGAVPGFDERFLTPLLRWYRHEPTWHYRVRDIQSLTIGYLSALSHAGHIEAGEIPPLDAGTDDLAVALCIDPAGYDRHSALGDCRLTAAMLDIVARGQL
jgi:DNA polymerase III epsilon subunit-like protein